jgi:hypothetical protein
MNSLNSKSQPPYKSDIIVVTSEPRVQYRGVFKSRADNKFDEFILLLRVSTAGAISRLFTRVSGAEEHIYANTVVKQTNKSVQPKLRRAYRINLHTFNVVHTHVIEWAPGVLQLRTNQRRLERPQSVWISELERESSDKSQHRKSLTMVATMTFTCSEKFICSSMITPAPQIVNKANTIQHSSSQHISQLYRIACSRECYTFTFIDVKE